MQLLLWMMLILKWLSKPAHLQLLVLVDKDVLRLEDYLYIKKFMMSLLVN